MNRIAAALLAPSLVMAAPAAAQTRHPATSLRSSAARDSLLAADRVFAAAAASRSVVDGLAAMLAANVTMPTPNGFLNGRDAVVAGLRVNRALEGSHARWRPIGGTVSADGRHGFTAGYLDMAGVGTGERGGLRYLAYWVRRPDGWRVVAYRLAPRPAGEAENQTYTPALPAGRSHGPGDAAASLRAAEQAFSDRARQVGLRAAFAAFGRHDAIHVAGREGFRIGLPAITAAMPTEVPAPVTWHSDRVIVAASGDLGLSIGRIYPNHPQAGQPAEIPFFTVWKREPGGRWLYIAE
jgi:ketosteroid isomerase-like protein